MTPRLLLTFDDNTVDHWFAHRGIFDETGARVTFFISFVDGLSDADSERLRILAEAGHTIASHGLRHLDAPAFVAEHGTERYLSEEIEPSIAGLAERGLAHRDFAYPYGRHDAQLDALLTGTFSWVRATSPRHIDERAREVLVDLADPHRSRVLPSRGVDVGRRGVANLDDSAALLGLLDDVAGGGSICLYAHDLADWDTGMAQGRNFITPDRLREILRAAEERGIVAEGFAALPD